MKKRNKEKDINKLDRGKRKRVQKRVYIVYGIAVIVIGQLISCWIMEAGTDAFSILMQILYGFVFASIVGVVCEIVNVETSWRYKLVDKLNKD